LLNSISVITVHSPDRPQIIGLGATLVVGVLIQSNDRRMALITAA
jgi:hypothetical protein